MSACDLSYKSVTDDLTLCPNHAFAQPYSFSVTVPSDAVGLKNLFAVGLIANETAVLSPVVTVDIEPGTPPTAINFQQSLVAFGYVGQQQRVGVTATFGSGSTLDISQSTQLTFASSNTNIATVDPTGLITSIAPGNATVTVSYGLYSDPRYADLLHRIRLPEPK